MKTGGIHFPGLDGIRALACLSVFAGHVFDYLNNRTLHSGFESWLYDHFINRSGAMGVSLFFVLSGFLITYLLLREKDIRGSIHVGYFYMKRILRIWPLFFVVTVAGFFVIPLLTGRYDSAVTQNHLPWFALFSNNFDRIHTGFTGSGNDSLGVLWSVAVEEQFYLVWPLVVLLCSKRTFPWIACTIILGSAAFRFAMQNNTDVIFYHTASVCGDLAIGGLTAWLGFYSEPFRNFFRELGTGVRVIVLLIVCAIIFNHSIFLNTGAMAMPGRIILSACFAWLISVQCFATDRKWSLAHYKPLLFIGTVSYGFYCFHMFVIMMLQKVNVSAGLTRINGWIFYAEFATAFIITLVISAFSYRFFERRFLKYRSRFDALPVTT